MLRYLCIQDSTAFLELILITTSIIYESISTYSLHKVYDKIKPICHYKTIYNYMLANKTPLKQLLVSSKEKDF